MESPLCDRFEEVQDIVQSTLDKVRTLSQALHPVVLDEAGLEGALRQHLPVFEKQTGIQIAYETSGAGPRIGSGRGHSPVPRAAGGAEQCGPTLEIGSRRGAAPLCSGLRGAGSGR